MALDPSDFDELRRAFLEAMRDANELGISVGSGGGRGGAGTESSVRDEETSAIRKNIDAINAATRAQRNEKNELDELNRLLETEAGKRAALNNAIDAETLSKLEARKAEIELEEATRNLNTVFKKLGNAASSLGNAVLNPEKGFKKYEDSLNTGSQGLSNFASQFGPWGKAIGVAVEQLNKLNIAVLRQTQSLLDTADGLAKAGAAGELSSKQIRELANQAGYTSKNMEGLFKASKALGTDILALGGNVTEGTKAFAKMAEENSEVLGGFRKLGFSQEEYTQVQSDSIKVMTLQGQIITKEMKDRNELAKISKEYAENLTSLSALTGQSREEAQKNIEQQNAAFNVQARLAGMAAEEVKLKEKIRTASGVEKEELEQRLKDLQQSRESFTTAQAEVASILSPDQLKAFKEISTTGTIISDQSAALNQLLGGRAIELVTKVTEAKSKEEYDRAMATFQATLGAGAISAGERYGGKAGLGTFTEDARMLGLSELIGKQIAKFGGKTEEEIYRERTKTRGAIRETVEGRGAVGEDPAQRTRVFIEKVERRIQIFVDQAVGALNPFTAGLGAGALTLVAFNASVLAATASLAMLAVGSKFGIPGATSAAGGLGKLAGKAAIAGAGGLATLGVTSALDFASEKAAKSGNEKTAKAIDVGSSFTTGLGMGASAGLLLGPKGALIGGALGGIGGLGYGLYKNYFGDETSQGKKEGEPPPPKGSSPGAATGGILTGPKTGFPATLHGTEAVVPLGDNKKIPVEFKLPLDEKQNENIQYLKDISISIKSVDRALNTFISEPEKLVDSNKILGDFFTDVQNSITSYLKPSSGNGSKDSNVPSAATGGILTGPKTGFPAILHGTEAVIPLDGKKIPIEFSYDNLTSTSEDIEYRELQKKNAKNVDENNDYLQKLIASVASLDKTLKKQIEDEENKEFEKSTGTGDKKNDKGKDGSKPQSQAQTQPAPKPVTETQPETPSILDKIRRGFGEMIPSWMKPSEETTPTTTPATPDQTAPTPIKTSKPLTGDRKEFTTTLYGDLLEEAKKQKLPNPEVIAKLGTAQSALETGFGKSLAGGQNYFGIKDFSGKGRNVQSTKEEIDGKLVEVRDAFRQYKNRQESVADYIKLITNRYSKVLGAKTPEEAARLVKEGGYATDSAYVQKLTKIMEKMSVDDGTTQSPQQVTKTPLPTTDQASLQPPAPLPGAADGGILSGPKEGYPVELHDKEAVIPLTDSPEKIRKHLAWIEENFAVTKNIGRNVGEKTVDKLGIENPIASTLTEKASGRITKELLKRLIPELGAIDKVASVAGKVGDISDIATSDSKVMDKVIDLIKLHPKVKAITFAYEFIKPYLDKANMASEVKQPLTDVPKPDNGVTTDVTSPINDLIKPYLDKANMASEVKQPLTDVPKPDLTPQEKSNNIPQETRSITSSPPVTTVDPAEEQIRMTEMIAEMLSSKFDAMIDKLNDANGIAEQQLRALRT